MTGQPNLTTVVFDIQSSADQTQRALHTLVRHTRPAWELVALVPADSSDHIAYLEGLEDAAPFTVASLPTGASNRGGWL